MFSSAAGVVPCAGTLNFQGCFVIPQSLISYFAGLIQLMHYACLEQDKNVFIFNCFAEQRYREDLGPTQM